jgi:hypothetical protein
LDDYWELKMALDDRNENDPRKAQAAFRTALKNHITEQIGKMTEEVQYGRGSIYALQMPSESCAQTALEILTGDPDSVEPNFQTDSNGKISEWTGQLATCAEIA